jgi:hypothetical protein
MPLPPDPSPLAEAAYERKVEALAARVNEDGAALETLVALVEGGPLSDGHLPSKRGRDYLFALGLAYRIVAVTPEHGWSDSYQAAVGLGRDVYNYIHGKSSSMREAKAFRLAQIAIKRMK